MRSCEKIKKLKPRSMLMKSVKKKIAILAMAFGCAIVVASLSRLGGVPHVTRQKEWSIGIYTGQSPLRLSSPQTIRNPVLSAEDVTDVPAKFVADPFMIRRDATWYMFFEVFNSKSNRGEIGIASSNDGLHWTYLKIVLAEPFHLSYPYVFKFGDTYYMIPESGQARSVRLYKSEDFPVKWIFVGNLLAGKDYADSSVFRYRDKWWLFTEPRPYVNDTLSLYYADSLEGPWREHPKSPIVTENPHAARPAGRVGNFGDKLIRFAQDDRPSYGTQVWAFEIMELTPTSYKERKASAFPIIKPGEEGWNRRGMHHLDPHWISGDEWIACVDGFQRRWGLRFYNWH